MQGNVIDATVLTGSGVVEAVSSLEYHLFRWISLFNFKRVHFPVRLVNGSQSTSQRGTLLSTRELNWNRHVSHVDNFMTFEICFVGVQIKNIVCGEFRLYIYIYFLHFPV